MTAKRRSRAKVQSVPTVPTFPPDIPPLIAAREGPVENGKRLVTLPRGMSEEMRVNWSAFNGHPFLHLRLWRCGLDGVWRPDRVRGCTVKVRELASFADAVQEALELATGHG